MENKQKDRKELFQAAKRRELMQGEGRGGERPTLSYGTMANTGSVTLKVEPRPTALSTAMEPL